MKILFVTPYLPSPTRPRSYNLIRGLVERGHEVSLFCIVTPEDDRSHLPTLHAICGEMRLYNLSARRRLWNDLRSFIVGLPMEAVNAWHPAMAGHLREAFGGKTETSGSEYDIIHVEHLRAARFGLIEPAQAAQKPPVVWDAVDSTSLYLNQLNQRSLRWRERFSVKMQSMRIDLYESWLLEQFDRTLVSSQQDHDWLLARQVPDKKPVLIDILSNGVDLDYFHAQPPESADPNTIVLSGNMALQANGAMAEFLVKEIMPLVWGRMPAVRVLIAGQNPGSEVRSLGRDPRITITGTVADIRPYLARGVIAVAPLLFNSGIQNKVLEAMASNRPVIATPQAVSGLQAIPGEEVLIAEDSIQFSEALLDLLQNPDRQRQIAQGGLAYATRHHRWPAVVERLEQIYAALIISAHTI